MGATMTQAPRKALITGASSGLGVEFALQMASRCDHIIVTGRHQTALDELAEKLRQRGLECSVVVADLATTIGMARLVETIRQQGPLDYLINHGCCSSDGHYLAQHPASQHAMVSLHINATMQLTLAALGGMTARGRGRIINVSSLAAFLPAASLAVYSGTAAFLNNFSEALQREVKSHGVKIQCLCPGYTAKELQNTGYLADVEASRIPDEYGITAPELVQQSLAALHRDDSPVVFIAGEVNRILARKALQKQLDRS